MVLRETRRQRTGMGRLESTIARLAVATALLSGVLALPVARRGPSPAAPSGSSPRRPSCP